MQNFHAGHAVLEQLIAGKTGNTDAQPNIQNDSRTGGKTADLAIMQTVSAFERLSSHGQHTGSSLLLTQQAGVSHLAPHP